jgi:uncharacterized protein YukE
MSPDDVWTPPPSPAIDAAAPPGVTPAGVQVVASPGMIAAQSAQWLLKAGQFAMTIKSLNKATEQLSEAWSGDASNAAVQKISATASEFTKIVQVIETGAMLQKLAATIIEGVQTGYETVVPPANAAVGSMMSNPFTAGAAAALAAATTGVVNAYVGVCQGALTALGSGNMMQQVMGLAEILSELDKLAGTGSASSPAAPAAPAAAPVTAPPVATGPGPLLRFVPNGSAAPAGSAGTAATLSPQLAGGSVT